MKRWQLRIQLNVQESRPNLHCDGLILVEVKEEADSQEREEYLEQQEEGQRFQMRRVMRPNEVLTINMKPIYMSHRR